MGVYKVEIIILIIWFLYLTTFKVTQTSIRGAMGSVKQIMMCAGLTFVNALGIENAVSWDMITILCIIPSGE